jgi:tetratricopeptide (TPR) repeat protein
MLALRPPAGIPEDLPPDELERWSNDLVAFLTSESVPANFRDWARKQASLLDAYLASAGDLESGLDLEDDEEDAPAPASAPVRAAPKAPKGKKARQRSAPAAQQDMMVLQVPAAAGKLIIGVVIGVVGIFAILGVLGLVNSGDGANALPATDNAAPAFDQARADELQQILQQDPTNKDALFELGEMNFEAERNEEAISWLTKLLELDPTNTYAMTDIGTANFNLGQPDAAKEWWQKVLTVDPNYVQAHYNLGFAYANVEPRDIAGAVREWDAVVQLDPESQLAQTAKVHIDGLKAELTATPAATP